MSESNADIELLSLSQRDKNKIYFENRKEIKILIKNINTCLDNNSSTFFLSLFYMDFIFENYSLEEIINEDMNDIFLSNNIYKINTYVLLSLACLVISSKFNEKDPHVPDLNSFLRVYNKYSKFYCIFSLNELMKAEVYILKILKYKLNYYSLYQFVTFFFSNGILFERDIQKSELIKKLKHSEKKILEKIYVKSREILDLIIDDYEKYYILFNGRENYITAIEILIWSIENILNIKIIDEQSICFPLFYNININYRRHIEIYSIIYNILNKNENLNISNSVINDNYNFNYSNYFINSKMNIIKKNNNNTNLCLMSVSNSNINLDDIIKKQTILSDFKIKNSKSFYSFKNQDKSDDNINYYLQNNEYNKINLDSSNILNSDISPDIYFKNINKNNKSIDNKYGYSMSDNMIPIMSEEESKLTNRENNIETNELIDDLTKEFNSNKFKDNEINEGKRDYLNYTKNFNISKNLLESYNNFNDIDSYNSNKKNYEKKNNYNNFDYIAKKINKDIKSMNKRNLNIDYNNNNSSKSTFYKSWFNNTNTSPKDILNKTKKIFDETNKRIIDYNNNENESSNIMVNSYTNKSNYINHLKDINNNEKDRKKSTKTLNSNIYDNDYHSINKYKEEKNKDKEKTIIINNNIQINNYIDKENNYANYYNNSQQNISDIENINFENYINKKYFNINKNSNTNIINKSSTYLNNNKNKKVNKGKKNKKINFKKIGFLEGINENYKDTKNSIDYNINSKSKENIKINKDKNNRIVNLGKFQTYFDYSSYGKNKRINSSNSSQGEFNFARHINYNNSSIIEKSRNSYGKYNNSLLKDMINNKISKFNNDSNIYEKYMKLNSEYVI